MAEILSNVPTYTSAERDRRWNIARTFMDTNNTSALIVFGEHEDAGPAPYYLDTWFTNGRPGSTIVFPRDGEPIELVPYHLHIADHLQSARRGDVQWTKPENFRLGRDAGALIDVVKELKLERSTIGVAGLDIVPPWNPEGVIPYTLWQKVLSQLPHAIFNSLGESFSKLLLPQGEEELAVVRHAAKIAEEMCKAMLQAAQPGVLESEVVAAGMGTAYKLGTHVPLMHLWSGDSSASNPDEGVAASGMPAWSYRPQAPRTLRSGDVVHSEVFGQFGLRGTQSQLMVAIGDVHPDIEKAARIARHCYEEGLRTLRPGVLFEDVCSAMLKSVQEAGGWTRGPQIHSLNPLFALCGRPMNLEQIGIGTKDSRYPDVGTAPTLLPDLEIKPGMVFAFEPSCAFGRHLVTIGGTVIVGTEGPIELNPFTAQLHRVNPK